MFKMQTMSKANERAIVRIPVEAIRANPRQPRRGFQMEGIDDLAASIRRHGLLTPLLVRQAGGGKYELIAGERRLRALISLNVRFADAIVLSVGDCESALIALIENIHREQLHFLDEAEACRQILCDHAITQEKLAASLSCSPSALANRLRLLKLPEEVREVVRNRGLSERHARALLKITDSAAQLSMASRAAEQRMSVKQLEARVDRQLRPQSAPPSRRLSPLIRDNRIVINALMDTVRELGRIGVQVTSRIEEREDHVELIVSIPACGHQAQNNKGDVSE